jgi:hypothetical protein
MNELLPALLEAAVQRGPTNEGSSRSSSSSEISGKRNGSVAMTRNAEQQIKEIDASRQNCGGPRD